MYHDENAPSLTDYTLEEIIQDIQFDGLFDSYDDFDDVGDDDDGVDAFHCDVVDEVPIAGDSSDDKIYDSDFLSQLLHHIKVKLLVGST